LQVCQSNYRLRSSDRRKKKQRITRGARFLVSMPVPGAKNQASTSRTSGQTGGNPHAIALPAPRLIAGPADQETKQETARRLNLSQPEAPPNPPCNSWPAAAASNKRRRKKKNEGRRAGRWRLVTTKWRQSPLALKPCPCVSLSVGPPGSCVTQHFLAGLEEGGCVVLSVAVFFFLDCLLSHVNHPRSFAWC
jgi:hypothetical protein